MTAWLVFDYEAVEVTRFGRPRKFLRGACRGATVVEADSAEEAVAQQEVGFYSVMPMPDESEMIAFDVVSAGSTSASPSRAFQEPAPLPPHFPRRGRRSSDCLRQATAT